MQNFFNKRYLSLSLFFFGAMLIISCGKDGGYPQPSDKPVINAVVKSAAGDSTAIVATLIEFRTIAGINLNTTVGSSEGRREVNWDAVPANLSNNNNFPANFFGSFDPTLPDARKRGLLMTNTGTSFRVDSTDFSAIDPSYAGQFEAFSRKKLFAYLGNNVTEVTFNVPGANTAAFSKSFGVIFSDVDAPASTTLEFFNGSKSLGVFKAAPAPQGFSFLGVNFPDEKITRVIITSGSSVLGAGVKDISVGGTNDLVVMDDFIYSEPRAL